MKAGAGADETAANRWLRHMRLGEFSAAWRISDAVLRERAGKSCAHWPRHEQYIWDGTPLVGRRVLIRCYHGLGDTVQFIRYAPRVKAVAREVIVWAQPALLPLLGTVAGIDRLLPLHDGSPGVAYDVDVELMELPHVFRSTVDDLPEAPYLRVLREWGPKSGLKHHEEEPMALEVGIVWRAGDWDGRRSVPPALLSPLAETAGVRWHLLQHGPERRAWPGEGVNAAQVRPEDTAAVMTRLDLVIAVDSFPAHLAGALGVPVWTLLHAEPDWRWMGDGSHSPWYPTMRLFRQARAGEWRPVIERVATELAALAAATACGGRPALLPR